jgi:hypothetical protein
MPAAAPRIDERLVRFIHGSPPLVSPAEITRGVGDLAWELGLQRPSYQQVRVLAQARRPPKRIDARTLVKVIDTLYEYPAPLLGDWYLRHTRGPLRS